MKESLNFKVVAVIGFFLLVFGILFWPTLYKYDTVKEFDSVYPIRINRITGYSEFCKDGAWIEVVKKEEKPISIEVLPSDVISEVTGTGEISGNYFNCELYNGSKWNLTSITIQITSKSNGGDIIWRRKFQNEVAIQSLSVSKVSIPIIGGADLDSWEWDIVSLSGVSQSR